ncbi:hypothetical protein PBI_ISCA_6 [Mycobacterium phage Isca]|uniref:Uncharacterized protein n=1 Tax=Mycobacterium phage Isca TaxID=2656583 RepID=A0A649VYI4_9CAUD|nr:hypothetical protein PBI_ISCA_6 [Mycobacterium phage Isca]
MTTFIQFVSPTDTTVVYQIDPAEFPDASTPEGQEAIEAAIAAVAPDAVIMGILVEAEDTVSVGEVDYPYKTNRVYLNLQDWFDSLSS